jgi:hypothetical protein
MKTIRRHIEALRYAYRVAVMTYKRELRQDSLPF